MRKHIPAELKQLLERRGEFAAHVRNRRFEQAATTMSEIRDGLQKAGWGYATASSLLSKMHLKLKRLDTALELAIEATVLEPLNPTFERRYERCIGALRDALEDPSLPATDERIERYHALLAREARTTIDTHLSLLRHLAATEQTEVLQRAAEALSTLHPKNPEVWRYVAAFESPAASPSTLASTLKTLALPSPIANA